VPRLCLFTAVVVAAGIACAPASALTDYQVAGIQVGLYRYGHYSGAIDGIAGPQTKTAIAKLQRSAGLQPDGVAGKKTRAALGKFGRPGFGSRVLKRGMFGYDVSVLQFLLSRRGFPPQALNSKFGPVTEQQVRKFQKKAGLTVDGVVGRQTRAALLLGPAKIRSRKVGPAKSSKRAAPARQTKGKVYEVKPGESLTLIAERHGTTVRELARRNRLDPSRVLLIGTRLVIPSQAMATARSSIRSSLDHWSAHYGVDPSLARALAWQESGWQQDVVSSAGALGVMQVTPTTWDFVELFVIGLQIPSTADGNVRVGVAYLDHLLGQFSGDVRLALAGYYQGPASVRRVRLFGETKRFVANVLALRGRV
jgi:peptidoglycan hydrolase-like protein with peptidoglycan-binding domain